MSFSIKFSIQRRHGCSALIRVKSAMTKHKLASFCPKSAISALTTLTGKPLLEYIQTLQISRAGLGNKRKLEVRR
jgi:hypothetical protein